ncbi:MAG: nucleotide exchange factor GrpE, partial [Ginsengibacter sp.]
MENKEKDLYEGDERNPIQAEDFSSVSDDERAEEFDSFPSSAENAKLKAELEEHKDKYVRLFAEFDNFKRRTAKERIELIQTAGKDVISSMLDVIDDIDRAEKQLQEVEHINQFDDGVQLIFAKLRRSLKARGLEPMESLGTEFDVEKHEAITEIPVEDKKLKGKVVDEIQKG